MDKRGHKTGRQRQFFVAPFVAFAVIALAPLSAHAQAMTDPMRPPAAIAPGTTAALPQSGLQGVITSPGRKLALIDGRVVPLGSSVRDGTLAGLSGSGAVVRKKDGELDVMFMHPNIDKRPARRPEGQ